jgi:ELWxxDGT repeat protein
MRLNRLTLIERLESRRLLASAALVKDIIVGSESSISIPLPNANSGSSVGVSGAKLFFPAIDADHGEEPWVSDGTAAGTGMLKDIDAGGGSSSPHDFQVATNGTVYFLASDGVRDRIYRTTGKASTTVQVGAVPASLNVSGMRVIGNQVIFFGFSTDDPSLVGLWRLSADGSTSTHYSPQFGQPINGNPQTVNGGTDIINGKLLYEDGTDHTLWETDGLTAQQISADLTDTSTTEKVIYNGMLYFDSTFASNGGGRELFRSDGTPGGTTRVSSIRPGNSPQINELTVSGGKLYFLATDGTNGFQIWSFDGQTVSRVTTLAGTSSGVSLRDLTDFGGTLFFTYSPDGGTRLLYKLAGGTTPTRVGTATGGASGGTSPGFLMPVGSTLYFSALDTAAHAKLFQTDGTTISLTAGDAGSDPAALVNVNGTLFFQADDATHGTELHDVAAATPPPPPPPTVAVRIAADKTTINEGDSINFKAILSSKVAIAKWQWNFGDGWVVGTQAMPPQLFVDNLPNDAARTVRIDALTSDKRDLKATLSIIVKNVKPRLKLAVVPAFVTLIPMPFSGVAIDPGVNDKDVVDISWGDGSVQKGIAVGKGGRFGGIHSYGDTGIFTIHFSVHDKDGAFKAADKTVIITHSLVPDVSDTANQALGVLGALFGGTPHSDVIEVKKDEVKSTKSLEFLDFFLDGSLSMVAVYRLKKQLGLIEPPPEIVSGGGNDIVTVDPEIVTSFFINTGAGNDTVTGGAGNDTINGGSGKNDLLGGKGINTFIP